MTSSPTALGTGLFLVWRLNVGNAISKIGSLTRSDYYDLAAIGAVGSTCNDGDATTENDVVQADCSCAGTPIGNPCANNGGDADGDGVPDGCDICAQGDDNVDTDGDGQADSDIEHFIVAYDWDAAARNGIERIAAKSGGWVYYLGSLAEGQDPYDMLKPVASAISGFSLKRLKTDAQYAGRGYDVKMPNIMKDDVRT